MDWVGVVMVIAVLIMGVVAVVLRRRMDRKLREVTEAREQLAQFMGNRDKSPEAAASAANAAASAAAAAVPAPAERRIKPSLHLVRDDAATPGAERKPESEPGGDAVSGGREAAPGEGGTGVPPDAAEEPAAIEEPDVPGAP